MNAVCPAWVDTPIMEQAIERDPKLQKIITTMSPLGRMAVPEEVVDVILFLCSASASYVTGTGLLIDSGITLTAHIV